MSELPDKYIIRTHDRMNFKTCRQKWFFSSPMNMHLELASGVKVLDFGTAFHRALEVYYNPETWDWDRDIVKGLSQVAFANLCKEHKTRQVQVNGTDLAIEMEQDFAERMELGKAMLNQYFLWAETNDRFRPLKTEIEFEVPIPVHGDHIDILPANFGFYGQELHFNGRPVVYQGKADLLLEDEWGDYWIDDHKTAAQASQLTWLAMDDQIGSYVWALRRQLNLPIKGFLYTEIFKKTLHEPKLNKNGSLSVNKQQDTNYDLFMQAIKRHQLRETDYADMLQYLLDNPKQTVRRSVIHRNEKELAIFERRLVLEAVDMLNKPSIYPNPSKMACNGCWFFDPCLATQEGSDVQFLINNLYTRRS